MLQTLQHFHSILSSSGTNMSYILENALVYSTLNPGFIAKKGNYLNYNNVIETPTGSKNGFVKNTITLKKYYNKNKNIFGFQTKLGNIFSLNNDDILTDDKFALGGRWLRGFDSYGAGPRNSRTSYIGGNNIVAAKLDYSYEISNQSNFPIFLNIFNDYGLIWENNTKPTQSDNNFRSSAGFGIKYYSPIGPIGFSWGFPLMMKNMILTNVFVLYWKHRLKLVYTLFFVCIIFLSIIFSIYSCCNIQFLIDNNKDYLNILEEMELSQKII